MEALRKRQDEIRFIQVRHEEAAAFMACAYAKFTGKLGVCFATSGPGAVHLMNGLLDAKVEQAPVLAITGMTYHDLIGTSYLQDVNIDYLMNDIAVYNQRIMGPQHVTNVVDYACRTALAQRGPAHIAFPIDYQAAAAGSGTRFARNVPGHTSPRFQNPVRIPEPDLLNRAADALAGHQKVAILAGAGARGAGAELEEAADKLGAPIIKAQLGKDCVPDDSPFTTGPVALVGSRRAAHRRLKHAVYRVLPGAGAGRVRPDRRQARADRPALSGRRGAVRRRAGHAAAAASAADPERGPVVPGKSAAGHPGVVGADGRTRHQHRHPDAPAGTGLGAE